jgi:hypothetical protein
MNDDELFNSYGDIPWEALGRINDEGYVDDPSIADSPKVFDDQFEMRSRELDRRPSGLQPVTIIPNKIGPWSKNPQLGIEQPFGASANNEQTILKLDEWDFPEVWTAMLGIEYDPNKLVDTAFFNIVASVRAGAGGVTQEFEVDWAEGMTFSASMNALNVVAKYENILGLPLVVPNDLKLRVSIAKGRIGNRPTRTFMTDSITALVGISNYIQIPKFATRVTPLSGLGGSAPYAATTGYFWQTQPNIPSTIGGFSGTDFLPFASSGIPIPPEARFIVVANGSAFSQRIRLMFHLAL